MLPTTITFATPPQGFMEIQDRWKAEDWEPEALMNLYMKAGARAWRSLSLIPADRD